MKKVLAVILVLVVMFSFLIIGCGKKNNETQGETSDDVKVSDVSTNLNETEIELSDGSSISYGENVSIPEDYPKDEFPIYKNAKIISAMKQNGGFALVFMSKDEVSKIVDYYKKALDDAKILSEVQDGTAFVKMGEIEGYSFMLMIDEDDTDGFKSVVTISLTEGSFGMPAMPEGVMPE